MRPIISPCMGLYTEGLIFRGAYIRNGLCLSVTPLGNMVGLYTRGIILNGLCQYRYRDATIPEGELRRFERRPFVEKFVAKLTITELPDVGRRSSINRSFVIHGGGTGRLMCRGFIFGGLGSTEFHHSHPEYNITCV